MLAKGYFFILFLFFCSEHSYSTEYPASLEKTLIIPQFIPQSVKIINAPDELLPYYQVLDKTHFSYRCFVPYTLKGKLAAVEVCEIFPVKLNILSWPETEIVHLISGKVSITEHDGTVIHYKSGDIFVLPEGFKGIWSQSGTVRKITVRHPLFWKE